LWILPADKYPQWPHFLLLSFYIFAFLFLAAIVISLADRTPETNVQVIAAADMPTTTRRVKWLWAALGLVILALYIIFNGH
jgi:SSS family solute:Na+ symporter